MTLKEIVFMCDAVPNSGVTETGMCFETDVQPNGKLGFIATLWETKGTGYREHLIEYGTGNTQELAKESLKNKILKS